jgi:hypothetical protein
VSRRCFTCGGPLDKPSGLPARCAPYHHQRHSLPVEEDVVLRAPLPRRRAPFVDAVWRERALAAEAQVRNLEETVGELLGQVRHELADEWYRRTFLGERP